jgi:CBS domain containing-hemolysin-like protein
VYDGRVDEVIGIVSLRQCLYQQLPSEDQNPEKLASQGIAQFVNTKVLFVPESKSVSALLDELRYQHMPMAVVVDEHGGVVGIITVEDLVAQIVGGIHDARNRQSAMVKPIAEGVFECDGKADVRELEEYMGMTIDNQGFETAAGLVLKIAGRIPRVNEHFTYGDFDIEVLAVRRRRIMKLRFRNKSLF